MRELIVATTNKDKLSEILDGLGDVPFVVRTLAAMPLGPDIEETAATLEGNALIKAFTYGKRFGKLILAEDTGLEVDALDGRPGVNTARYAPGTHKDRNMKLIAELADVPTEKRTARFRSVIAIYDPERDDKVLTCEGACEGRIVEEPRGEMGWGYDPVFDYESRGKTGAEMPFEQKKQYNHRSRAAASARKLLEQFV